MNAIKLYRMAHWCYKHHLEVLAKVLKILIYLLHNSSIPYTAQIGGGTVFGYKGIGCVIHARAVIGQNCVIGTNVTIGGRSHIQEVPIIGNNVYIGTGAKILGDVVIGDNCVIGANAVVVKSVPANCVAAGVPAIVIKENIDIKKYM